MAELDKMKVYAVNRDNQAAWDALIKIVGERGPQRGQIIPLTESEFNAIKDSVLCLEVI